MALKKLRNFFELEATAGLVLGFFALLAIVIANSPFAHRFLELIESRHVVRFDDWHFEASAKEWIKEGLMTIFFFHVGLEIKKEIMAGSLSDPKLLAAPLLGALGGMIAPALIFLGVIYAMGAPELAKGWPIPTATDIGFAIAAFALVSKNISKSLRVFLLTLAVIDDLGAVALIAALFGHSPNYTALFVALSIFGGLLLLSAIKMRRPWIFVVGGIFIWAYMLKSGFHPTLAGVITAAAVPLKAANDEDESPLEDLHDDFSAWVKYLILPLFALTNSGFSFASLNFELLLSPLVIAIILGLVAGKFIGVTGAVFIAQKLKFAKIDQNIRPMQFVGASFLCGIGYTMSLFLGSLALGDTDSILSAQLRIGVFTASIIAAIIGITILSRTKSKITKH